ncbi:hypothetical protein KR018_001193 [Drosophila ironensis]|nr:hypothetical protein KR018_001193 [Drosophila ironensis]
MEANCNSRDCINPLVNTIENWMNSINIMPDQLGRFVAIILALIVFCYIVLFVSRIVVALAFPVLVVICILLFYRLVNIMEIKKGFLELPETIAWCKNFVVSLIHEPFIK